MPGIKRAAAICGELAAMFREAGESGKALEHIDELVAAAERAANAVAATAGATPASIAQLAARNEAVDDVVS